MDISAEKEDIIRRFKQVHDINLIKAIKNLLDFGLARQEKEDDEDALEASVSRGMKDCENGLMRPHEEVMAELRKRYDL